jgi:hypothetical protein
MAWIASHQNLEHHPKTLMLMEKTGWSLDETIGRLHRFWWWVLDYAEDGCLKKWVDRGMYGIFMYRLDSTKKSIDLYNIFVDCEWIDKDGKIHDWLDIVGRYLDTKYRSSNPKKLKQIQRRYKLDQNPTKNRPKVRPRSGREDKIDKIREDNIYNTTTKASPVSEKTKELLKTVNSKGFPIYELLGKMKKAIGWIPDVVVNRVCESWLRNSSKIINPWPWFIKGIEENWKSWNGEKNISENERLKRQPVPEKLKELMKGIG